MLTVKEINEVSFGKAGFSGYKPEDVDNFIDEVVESFTQLQAERDDALQQSTQLNQQMEELNRRAEGEEQRTPEKTGDPCPEDRVLPGRGRRH